MCTASRRLAIWGRFILMCRSWSLVLCSRGGRSRAERGVGCRLAFPDGRSVRAPPPGTRAAPLSETHRRSGHAVVARERRKGGVGARGVVYAGHPKRGSREESALLGGGSRSYHGPSDAAGRSPHRLHGSQWALVLLAQSTSGHTDQARGLRGRSALLGAP